MRKLKRFFLSRRTAISLICVLCISCLIGSTIPQLARESPQFFETWRIESPKIYYLIDLFQLNQVYTSIWFLVLVGLIACSLLYSIYYQSKILIRLRKPVQKEVTQETFKNYHALRIPSGTPASIGVSDAEIGQLSGSIKKILRDSHYRPCLATHGSTYFIFHKNRIARWGSVVFHVGLLFIIMAALYGMAFHKSGFIQLIQTDTFDGRDDGWDAKRLGVFAEDFDLGYQVRLNEFVPTYGENDQVKDLESRLAIITPEGQARELPISLSNRVHFNGTKIYQSRNYGYALGFVLQKEGGQEPVGTNFLLDAPSKKDQPFAGKMDFPTTDYILDMKFHPNLMEPSFFATLPGVYLTVTEKGEEMFKGRVLFSQWAELGEDSLNFAQVHYWTSLTFVRNYGMPLVYCGFALGTLGAVLIFMLPYREVHLKVVEEGDQIHLSLGGRTKRYGPLFLEEFKNIAERIGKEVGGHGNHSVTQI